MKRAIILIGAFVLAVFYSTAVLAGTSVFNYTGVVTSIDDESDTSMFGGVQVNDTITGYFAYDPNLFSSDSTSTHEFYSLLGQPGSSFALNLGGTTLTEDGAYYLQMSNDQAAYTTEPTTLDEWNIHVNTTYSTVTGFHQINLNAFSFFDIATENGPLPNLELPTSYDVSEWDYFYGSSFWYIPGPTGANTGQENTLNFSITSINAAPVPEPATMLLLGSGMVGLAGFGRKFKK